MNGARLPLAGIRVIDLSRVLAGPVCGALLGDKGADVIKVEDVEGGNESRHWAPQREGHSPVYVANNRNKRSIAVDLKAPEGRDIVAALIDTADVLIENFGTGAMERLGLGYDTLAARNPRLVYCSIAAFGRQGPRADEAGYEALMQAFSGVMSITGEPGRPPVRCGVSALDIFTGTLAGFAVSNAILMRQTSGVGQRLDASLFDSAVGLLNFQAQNYLLCGQKPAPMGSAHPSLVPYQCFLCHDHRWIFVAAGNDRLWRRLATAIGQPDLADDPRFLRNIDRVAHRRELLKLLDGCFASLPLEDALERCRQAGVPAAPSTRSPRRWPIRRRRSWPRCDPWRIPTLARSRSSACPWRFPRFRPCRARPRPRTAPTPRQSCGTWAWTATPTKHQPAARPQGIAARRNLIPTQGRKACPGSSRRSMQRPRTWGWLPRWACRAPPPRPRPRIPRAAPSSL